MTPAQKRRAAGHLVGPEIDQRLVVDSKPPSSAPGAGILAGSKKR